MSLRAGRVGVNPTDVDSNGHVRNTGGDSYTKQQIDAKFETKSHIGGLQFRSDDGQAQYKVPNGDWTNFSSGGGSDDLLWENPSPSLETYSGGTISLPTKENYKYLRFEVIPLGERGALAVPTFCTIPCRLGNYCVAGWESSYLTLRNVVFHVDTLDVDIWGYLKDVSPTGDISARTNGSGFCIIKRIYGVK